MTEFGLYFQLGLTHIADFSAYDHILFVIALCISYPFQAWRKLLMLITAFTIGHSLTLALSVLKVGVIASDWVEFLIPVTIILTALFNLRNASESQSSGFPASLLYGTTLFFGLIHGLGFSNYLKALLGKETTIFQPLLAFNLGLEVGQILIAATVFLTLSVLIKGLGVAYVLLKTFICGLVIGIAFTLLKLPYR